MLAEHRGEGALAGIAAVERDVEAVESADRSTYMQALCALAVMLPAFLATPAPLRQLNAATLPLIVYAGALASVVLPFLWIRGVAQPGPNRGAIFMNLLPVLTAAAAIVMLGEPVRSFHVIGGGLTLLGVACAQALQRPLRTRKPRLRGSHAADA